MKATSVQQPAHSSFTEQGLMKATRAFVTDHSALLLLAMAGTLIHILLNGQYGFHRDELDFIMNAR